ncbi:hypothetical protein NEDG_01810 [Nematocida displodere]|uniref:Exocyst complex component Sec3 coiled-coil domain-containing protein n=1 Tax=Nematocida displodere TaxID=1805483 RepID=A0A177EJL9_9MICR|nr:hypothetical protein NEDG_01810 [Nematocida displodere]
MGPDELFKEPWAVEGISSGASEGLVGRAEETWRRVQREGVSLEKAQDALEQAVDVLGEVLGQMEGAREDVLEIEHSTAEKEAEIANKQAALKVLNELIEQLVVPEEALSVLAEPWLESLKEVPKIEEALKKVKGVLGIDNQYLLKVPAVHEGQGKAQRALSAFSSAARKYLIGLTKKKKRDAPNAPTIHALFSRYTTIIEYLTEEGEAGEVVGLYIESQSGEYQTKIAQETEKVVNLFKKSKEKRQDANKPLSEKVDKSFTALLQLLHSQMLNEAFFLIDVLGLERPEQGRVLGRVFKQAGETLTQALPSLYKAGWPISVLNLQAEGSIWSQEYLLVDDNPENTANPDNTEKLAEQKALAKTQMETVSGLVKKQLSELTRTYLSGIKKTIAKEYAKEGALDLDKVYFDIVDTCTVREINTEVAQFNIQYSGKIQSTKERVFFMAKRACVLGAMHTDFIERKEFFDIGVGKVIEEEMEKVSKELLYLAEAKVFEKEKLSSIIKRARELMDVLMKVDGVLGFKIQMDFKDMVLTKANFHQKNEIAKALTTNASD